jgi:ATP-dependent protease ClpP protease subunit/regulator of replication initiation timing
MPYKSKGINTMDIFIYGIIGEGDNTAANFATRLKEAENSNEGEIKIRINSPGGYVSEGIAIFNLIHESKHNVVCHVDGIAYSMAAMIALAKKTTSSQNALMLLHNVSGIAIGNAKAFKETGAFLEKMDLVLANMIAKKTGLKTNEVMSKFLNYSDNLFTAEEAKELKLIDEITNENSNAPITAQYMNLDETFAYYRKDALKREQAFFGTGATAKAIDKITNLEKELSDLKAKNLEILKENALLAKENAELGALAGTPTELERRTPDSIDDRHTFNMDYSSFDKETIEKIRQFAPNFPNLHQD